MEPVYTVDHYSSCTVVMSQDVAANSEAEAIAFAKGEGFVFEGRAFRILGCDTPTQYSAYKAVEEN